MEIDIKFRKKGCWSIDSDKCKGCMTKRKKHFAKGYCSICYQRAYREAVKIKNKKNDQE